MSNGKRIYVAGPMSGLPECNYPAFDDASRSLSALGFDVVNPANIGRSHFGGRTDLEDDELEFLLAEELSILVGCDSIYLLRGWERSKGARKELYHALGNGLNVVLQGTEVA